MKNPLRWLMKKADERLAGELARQDRTYRTPTFDERMRSAHRLIDVAEQDHLCGDWDPDTRPDNDQLAALHDAQALVAEAKAALQRALGDER